MKIKTFIPILLCLSPLFAGESNLTLIPEGVFNMGTLRGVADERKVYGVKLSGYYIGTFEVTQGEFEAVMGYNPSKKENGFGPDFPVNNVTWYDAVDYCNALSELEGLTPCYSGSGSDIRCDFSANGYRLPTEAEWEYAARGGSESKGLTFSGSKNIDEIAWYKKNSESAQEIGLKKANEIGIFDMSGNIAEWCWDWYGDYFWDSQPDPKGLPSGTYKVNRGGSWRNSEDSCRYADRYYNDPYYRRDNLGFRVVRPE